MRPATLRGGVLLGVLLAGSAALAQNGSAALWPRGTRLDFGELATRVEATDTLWLTNPRSAPFAVETIRASCGCTAVDWPAAPVSPGDTVAIPVAFRCTRGGGPVERHLDVWLTHLHRPERIVVAAICPPRGE